jgi:hypothetical protein
MTELQNLVKFFDFSFFSSFHCHRRRIGKRMLKGSRKEKSREAEIKVT